MGTRNLLELAEHYSVSSRQRAHQRRYQSFTRVPRGFYFWNISFISLAHSLVIAFPLRHLAYHHPRSHQFPTLMMAALRCGARTPPGIPPLCGTTCAASASEHGDRAANMPDAASAPQLPGALAPNSNSALSASAPATSTRVSNTPPLATSNASMPPPAPHQRHASMGNCSANKCSIQAAATDVGGNMTSTSSTSESEKRE